MMNDIPSPDTLGLDTLGLIEESLHLAHEVGYHVREEPLGDLPGGPCVIGGRRTILLNLESTAADRLTVLLGVLAGDALTGSRPKSRLLAARLHSATQGDAQGSD